MAKGASFLVCWFALSWLVLCSLTSKGAKATDDESWTYWAKDKLSEGFGIKHEDTDQAMKKVGDAAVKTKEIVTDATSGAAKLASDWKDKVVDAGNENYDDGKRRLHETYEFAKDAQAKATDAVTDQFKAAQDKDCEVKGNVAGVGQNVKIKGQENYRPEVQGKVPGDVKVKSEVKYRSEVKGKVAGAAHDMASNVKGKVAGAAESAKVMGKEGYKVASEVKGKVAGAAESAKVMGKEGYKMASEVKGKVAGVAESAKVMGKEGYQNFQVKGTQFGGKPDEKIGEF
ncbi:uncharacterized protein LOC143846209 [Tasmannia lanceolata]|uniref:uncharacterized protein LOC143846209 n=1 Tax=Tasmannia lanceolata TaxID=3420 RepID=UPI004063B1EE